MAVGVRVFLTLLFVANVRSGLLPINLSGVSPTNLLHLGLDTPNGGLLGSLSRILSSGVGTVGTLGSGILGKLTALNDEHHVEPTNAVIYLQPWQMDFSYSTYQKYVRERLRDGVQPLTYAEWINVLHDEYEGLPDNDFKEPAAEEIHESHKPNTNRGSSHKKIHKKPTYDPNLDSSSAEMNANHKTGDAIQYPDSDEVSSEQLKDTISLKKTHKPHNSGYDNQVIILQPGGIQSNGYVPNVAANSGYQDAGVPKIPTVYKDEQGRLYYIVQADANPPIQPIPPVQLVQPTQPTPSMQGFIMLNVNGQQVLVPVSSITANPSQIGSPNPTQNYVFAPPNNVQTQNPVVSYVTTPKYVSFEKQPSVTESVPEVKEVTGSDNKENGVDNTRDAVSEPDGAPLEDASSIKGSDIRQ